MENTTVSKKAAYSPEETKTLLDIWNDFTSKNPTWFEGTREEADKVISNLAIQLGKSTKSIVQKLTRLEKYKAKNYQSKSGKPVEPKEHKAEAIGKVLELSEPEVDSLVKANKTVLDKILIALSSSIPLEVLSPDDEEKRAETISRIAEKLGLDSREALSLTRLNKDLLIKIAANVK